MPVRQEVEASQTLSTVRTMLPTEMLEAVGKVVAAKRMAILVMMAPGCEAGKGRVFGAIKKRAPEIDTFASLDGIEAKLPEWVAALHPPAGTEGIVRPTKWCVTHLGARYDWLLRLTWDAELASIPTDLEDRTVYGTLREDASQHLQEIVAEMGGPPTQDFRYANGYAILAPMKWWLDVYRVLPSTVVHYADDSASSQWGTIKGWALREYRLAAHRHEEWRA